MMYAKNKILTIIKINKNAIHSHRMKLKFNYTKFENCNTTIEQMSQLPLIISSLLFYVDALLC